MALSPEVLLSNLARNECVSRLKELPMFLDTSVKPKIKAAVLVPLFVQNGEVHLLYTVRSPNLKSFSGQVSFPGGKMDDNEGVIDAALRETDEEIGVPANSIDIWSEMSPVQGHDSQVVITPVVGVIKDLNLNNLKPNIYEVDEIFSIPMSSFCITANHAHFIHKGVLLPVFLHEKHKIWGLTGFITHNFLQAFLPSEMYKSDFTRKRYTIDELLPSKL